MREGLLGARAGNAGTDFHIVWAVAHVLRLLVPDSDLHAISVEGIGELDAGDDAAKDDPWLGVDLALFFGGETLSTAKRIEFQQLKYSTADPDKPWSVARLCKPRDKRGKNSVIARLAQAYSGAVRAGLAPAAIALKLVSNQPVNPEVLAAINAIRDGARSSRRASKAQQRLLTATGLAQSDAAGFFDRLDLNECGAPSRFEVQARVIQAIQVVATPNSRQIQLELWNLVYKRMLPGDLAPITKETVIGAMLYGTSTALLPCPPALVKPLQLLSRNVSLEIANELNAHRRLCVHGQGGCGKTTTLFELRNLLPSGSELLVFDCYGGGTYLDSEGQRHLPRHAFLHLCNELSARVATPLLIPPSGEVDYAREFAERLRKASRIISARDPSALLVVAVDAADNSVTAANSRVPPERSFVHEFASLGELPDNVRLVVSARTGRLDRLRLGSAFHPVIVGPFTEAELETLCVLQGRTVSPAWLTDAHALSAGNPRVLSYAFKYADETGKDALDYLRPTGKTLEGVFEARIREALSKSGDEPAFDRLCAALSALQRPILMTVLARVASLTEPALRDVLSDMAPGILVQAGTAMFSDEDFEHFIDTRATPHLAAARRAAADELLRDHRSNEYCAEHVASALLLAERGPELLQLAHDFPEPKAIRDPVRRREVQLQRLKLAMQVAKQAGDTVKSITVMLRGARALRTDSAVRKILQENMDLSAKFAAESLKRNILLNRNAVSLQGAALSQLMLSAAQRGHLPEARAARRQFEEWLQRCFEHNRTCERHQGWPLGTDEIVALAETAFLVDGVEAGVKSLARWTPRSLMLPAVVKTAWGLILSGHAPLVQAALAQTPDSIWMVLIQALLARAGHAVDPISMDRHLKRWVRRGWLTNAATARHLSHEASETAAIWPLLLQAAEVVVSKAGMQPGARQVFETFASGPVRSLSGFSESRTEATDCALRSFTLLDAHLGNLATAHAFFGIDEELPAISADASRKEREQFNEKKKRREAIAGFVQQLLPFYAARAALLLDEGNRRKALEAVRSAVNSYGNSDYRSERDYDQQQMRKRLRQTLAESTFISQDLIADIVRLATSDGDCALLADRDFDALSSLILHHSAQNSVLAVSLKRAQSIQQVREPATDKAAQLVKVARVVSAISSSEAGALFTLAVESLQDVDYDVGHELSMVGPFAKRAAASGVSLSQRRVLASNLIDVTARTWSFVGENDVIPWDTLVESLAHLDLAMALAAISRWADEGVAALPGTLSVVLKTAAPQAAISNSLIIALSYLTGKLDPELLKSLLQRASVEQAFEREDALEELARIAVLNVDGSRYLDQVRQIALAGSSCSTRRWLAQAAKVAEFATKEGMQDSEGVESEEDLPLSRLGEGTEKPLVLSSCAKPFTTPEEIRSALREYSTQGAGVRDVPYVSEEDVLAAIRDQVRLADRRQHLEALEQLQVKSRYTVPDAIAQAVIAWAPESPAVRAWCSERLPSILAERLPWFVEHLAPGYHRDSKFMASAGLSDTVLVASILDGLEMQAAACDSASIYRALGVVGSLAHPEEAAAVLSYHLAERAVDVDPGYVRMDLADIPIQAEAAAARFIYASLGDIELSVRWQAAHALRACARLKLTGAVDNVFDLWGKTQEKTFRSPHAPFYWCAARLWQMLAAARIARECPSSVTRHQQFFLEVLKDAEFPHVLVRTYAREALIALQVREATRLTTEEERIVAAANTSKLPYMKSAKSGTRGFDRFGSGEGRRFHFNSTDTLPYWYEHALRPFAKVSSNAFLELAEAWIIDRWGATLTTWKWVDEPRKYRFERNRLSTSHRHGSLPSVERYSTHLEWHAMLCVVGELLETEPLVKVKPGEYESFEYFLARHQLTESPLWLSDFRQCKPLEPFLWEDSTDDSCGDSTWLSDVGEAKMLAYLGGAGSADIPISARENGIRRHRRWSTEVSSALVHPTTAAALLRALQGAGTSWDYALPGGGHTEDINQSPFVLKEWIAYPSKDIELDQDDPLRREVGIRQALPARRMRTWLNFPAECDEELRWTSPDTRYTCVYLAWSDERTEADRYSSAEGCAGYRLVLNKEGLQRVLDQSKMDLLVEVTCTRRTKEYSIDDDDQEEPSESEFDYVVVLRKDGTIESARGPVGVWRTPGAVSRTE
jgi:hypothetical protein